ncbi:1,4-alpha-glucan branching enzyme, partial [Oscillatoriales cyanobacterium LEGE 11467]|nr:1,4-alpha-glucan branching enzyme [Zarconia navalis LEGE 11467]
MSNTIASEQIDRIIYNQHHDPFEVLGLHDIDRDGKKVWVVRAYLPDTEAAWVVFPEARTEQAMQSVHHPHFFECILDDTLAGCSSDSPPANYQLKTEQGDRQQVIYDPYAFRSSKLTDLDIHLFAEGNHHRIYEKLGAHLMTVDGVE